MRQVSLIAISLLAASGPALGWWSDDCGVEQTTRKEAATTGITRIQVDARAGMLEIAGYDDVSQLEVEAHACATDDTLVQQIYWGIERRGDVLHLTVDLPEHRDDEYARLDLDLRIPAGVDLDVSDTSGSVKISRSGALRLRDSSGSIQIVQAAGAVLLDDSSGSISVRGVDGPVSIRDGSGSIEVRGLRGSLRIVDGSGSINVEDVDGDVEVERDGSGSITVADIGGDFIVGRDGSGGISHRRVAGIVKLPED